MAMEIDTDNNLKESPTSQQMLLSHNNYPDKPCNIKDEFPFEVPSSAKATFLNNQDFHHLDQDHDQFQLDGSSPNPIIGVQTGSNFDSFDAFPYGSSINMDFYDYDIKPFGDTNHHHQVIMHGQVMDNFQANEGGQGEGYLSFPMLPQRYHPIDLVGPNQDHINNHEGDMSLNIQEAKPVNFVVPDELSCVTASQDCYKNKVSVNNSSTTNNNNNNNKGLHSTKWTSGKNRKRSTQVKGQWTSEEDRLLVQLVEQHGIRKWSLISQMLPGRIGKQCRERWHNHLRPDIKKDTWSEQEDRVLIEAHAEIGNKWAEIAKRLPGRTENSIKNHWNATKRRQYSKRKCRSKYPRGSLLQDYIKSLNLDAPEPNTTTISGKVLLQEEKHSAASDKPNLGLNNKNTSIDTMVKVPSQPSHELDYCLNDRLVPTFDFNEVPDFDFGENMFQEGCCNIDSLLDEIPCTHVVDGKNFCVDSVAPVLMADVEVKKEIDLVEMISQDKM